MHSELTADELARVLDRVPDGVLVVDRAQRVVHANEAARRLLGADIGRRLPDVAPAFGTPEIQELLQQALAGQAGRQVALPNVGDGRRLEATVAPSPAGAIWIFRDVTDSRDHDARREARIDQLDAGVRWLEAVLEELPIGVAIADAHTGTVRLQNRQSQRLLGHRIADGEVSGFSRLGAQHPDGTPYRTDEYPLVRAMRGERILQEEMLYRRADGRLSWLSISAAPVYDEHGALTHAVSAYVDVTGRRKLEAELAQAQKLEAVGQLAGGMAHEVNNMLTVVLGFTSLVAGALGPDHPQARGLDNIRRAAERAASVTRQVLTFSQRQILRPEVINLNDIVRSLEPTLRSMVGADRTLVIDLDADPLWVRVDGSQLQQALVNLLANARDATPSGGRIEVVTRQGRPGVARLCVKDDGRGMDDVTRSRAFDPFFTTKPVGEGTGLGLATVYGIVQQSEGEISLHSEVGLGTTVTIELPEAAPAQASTAEPAAVPAGAGATVLVVEDEALVRELTSRVLERAGYDVVVAGDGVEALETLAGPDGKRVDLVLTDLVMPRMNGRELADRLAEQRPDIPVAYMTGYAHRDVADRNLLHQGDIVLAKPFGTQALLEHVRRVLASSPGG